MLRIFGLIPVGINSVFPTKVGIIQIPDQNKTNITAKGHRLEQFRGKDPLRASLHAFSPKKLHQTNL